MHASRTVFPPEVDTSKILLASRTVWLAETDNAATSYIPTSQTLQKVQRPPGEVGRPHDGGFALKSVLGWSDRKYSTVRAGLPYCFHILHGFKELFRNLFGSKQGITLTPVFL
jgi:hypothetical protein